MQYVTDGKILWLGPNIPPYIKPAEITPEAHVNTVGPIIKWLEDPEADWMAAPESYAKPERNVCWCGDGTCISDTCDVCDGSGYLQSKHFERDKPCPFCNGNGIIEFEKPRTCPDCGGRSYTVDGRVVMIDGIRIDARYADLVPEGAKWRLLQHDFSTGIQHKGVGFRHGDDKGIILEITGLREPGRWGVIR